MVEVFRFRFTFFGLGAGSLFIVYGVGGYDVAGRYEVV